jgi:hypothetical protein
MTVLSILQSSPLRRGRSEGESLAPRGPARPFDLRCASCGYGVAVRIAPDRCSMCGGSTWEHPAHQMRPLDLAAGDEQPEAALWR